jgi:hypothetical protein
MLRSKLEPYALVPRFTRLLLQVSLLLLALASVFFWWRQHSARQQNAVLRAEIMKLRERLRALRR